MKILSKTLIITAVIASLVTSVAMANCRWAGPHPRAAQINQRLINQHMRIQQKVQAGEMSRAQAWRLHQAGSNIFREERAMMRQNGGFLTKQQLIMLNRQENQVSRQIGR